MDQSTRNHLDGLPTLYTAFILRIWRVEGAYRFMAEHIETRQQHHLTTLSELLTVIEQYTKENEQ